MIKVCVSEFINSSSKLTVTLNRLTNRITKRRKSLNKNKLMKAKNKSLKPFERKFIEK